MVSFPGYEGNPIASFDPPGGLNRFLPGGTGRGRCNKGVVHYAPTYGAVREPPLRARRTSGGDCFVVVSARPSWDGRGRRGLDARPAHRNDIMG